MYIYIYIYYIYIYIYIYMYIYIYISLVRSQVLYCSQIWRTQLLKDIQSLERIQHKATIFILNNYSLPHKLCL